MPHTLLKLLMTGLSPPTCEGNMIDVADIKPSVLSALTVFIMVAVTVPLAKYVLNRWPLPGVTPLVNSI